MDLPSQDLEEYVEKFENLFSNQKVTKQNQNELLFLIENISSELRICKKSENVLRNNLKILTESESVNLNQKYIILEEKCTKLEKENTLLFKQNEELNVLMRNELETQKTDFLNKIKDIEDKSNSEIINLKNQLESSRICHEIKESELYNELQVTQAASAIELDEKESNLKNQLAEAKINLRQCQNNVCRLRFEVNQLRNQLSLQKTTAENKNVLYFQETPIQQIKNKLVQKYVNDENFEYYSQNQMRGESVSDISSTEQHPPNPNQIYYNTSREEQTRYNTTSSLKAENTFSSPFSSVTTAVNNQDIQRNDSTNKTFYSKTYEPNEKHYENKPSSSLSPSTTIDIRSLKLGTFKRNTSLNEMHNPFNFEENKSSGKNDRPLIAETTSEKVCHKAADFRHKHNAFLSSKKNLPPLWPCSDVTNDKNTNQQKKTETNRKKRKLYDPSITDYLA